MISRDLSLPGHAPHRLPSDFKIIVIALIISIPFVDNSPINISEICYNSVQPWIYLVQVFFVKFAQFHVI